MAQDACDDFEQNPESIERCLGVSHDDNGYTLYKKLKGRGADDRANMTNLHESISDKAGNCILKKRFIDYAQGGSDVNFKYCDTDTINNAKYINLKNVNNENKQCSEEDNSSLQKIDTNWINLDLGSSGRTYGTDDEKKNAC